MMLLTSGEMAKIDTRAQSEFEIPGAVLMESAGRAAWQHLSEEWLLDQAGRSVVFLVGHGNNGGDALVMARYCDAEGVHIPRIILARDAFRGDADLQRRITRAMGIPCTVWADDRTAAEAAIRNADVVVDGLAGTGLTGPLRAPLSDIARLANESSGFVVAIDCPSGVGDSIPSGLDDNTERIQADLTLTLGLPKRCLYDPRFRGACGEIRVIPFAIPRQLIGEDTCSGELLSEPDLRTLLPAMPSTAHKGQRGVVAVYAGAPGTTGAAVLAAQAALSAGAGLVTVIAGLEAHPIIASRTTSVMVRAEDDDHESLIADPERFGAAVVGPGWGISEARSRALAAIVRALPAGVVDADGLTLLAGLAKAPRLGRWVLTPHPGELARLNAVTKEQVMADFFGAALAAARAYDAVVAAKASTSVIARPDGRICVVDGVNPAMATAGSGDVLSGTIGALLARGASPWDAARAGVLAHSVAGRRLRDQTGLFRSSRLPDAIGSVMGNILFRA